MRIAHISDFHLRHHLPGTSSISRRLCRRMPDLIAQAVDQIRSESPDLVAVTGDLVDFPFYGWQDPDVLALGEKDLRLVHELFEPLRCPVAFLFGNHDHPGAFQHVFGEVETDFETAGHRVLSFLDEEVDSHFPRRLGAQRERFLAALSDDDPTPQIHLQHYLIAPERNEGYPHTYLEADSLREALTADPRARLALCGHYHRGEDLFADNGTHFGVAPAFSEPPHPYRIYEIADGAITQTEHKLRSGAPGEPQKAVFLDRDGNINPQPGYRTGPEDFRLIDGAGEALARLKAAGYALVVVSNQTAVGQGYVTVETVGSVNDRMSEMLRPYGVEFDGVYCRYHGRNAVVPGHRTDALETKPDPAMLRSAAEDLELDVASSFMVGDRASDLEAGHNAGCRASILVKTGGGRDTLRRMAACEAPLADFVAEDLAGAANWILGQG